jgi:hypothetical protein
MLDRPNVSEPTKSAGDNREQPSAAIRTMAAQGEVSRRFMSNDNIADVSTGTRVTRACEVVRTIVIVYFRAIRRPFLHTKLSLPFKTLSQKSVHSRIFTSSLLLSGYELSFHYFLRGCVVPPFY